MKLIKIIFFIAVVITIFGCSETPNEVPFNSLRNVTFQIDLNQKIADGEFDVVNDTIAISGEFNNWAVQALTDSNVDGIYTINMVDLILGATYEYTYYINSVSETIENRTFTVQDVENSILDYYNVLVQTLVVFKVNMNYQIELGTFDPSVDFVDIAGDINEWTSSGPMDDSDADNIFEITYSNVEPGFTVEFKFRINGDWETGEFPGGGPNRSYDVVEGENIAEYWFNDEQPE